MLLATQSFSTMAETHENPFLKPYDTKYEIPPFDKITTGDFIPAIEAGSKEQDQNLRAITMNRAMPDFDNTILPLENLSPILERVQGVFYHYLEAMGTPDLPKCRRKQSLCSTTPTTK